MLLSLSIWVPIAAGLLVLAAGGDRNAPLQRSLALVGAIFGFLVTLPLYTGFSLQTPGMQFVERIAWIPRFNINYHLGVDGISVLFILLNSFITVLVVIAGWTVIEQRVGAVHGRLPHHVRPAERRLRGAGRDCCSTSSSRRR